MNEPQWLTPEEIADRRRFLKWRNCTEMLESRLLDIAVAANEMLDAIRRHHSQKADDRCIEDDDFLYAAAGLPPCDRRVGSKDEMLANCKRYIEQRCEGGGPWKSYAELESEIVKLNSFKAAYLEWSEKTDWVQEQIDTFPIQSLAKHRADVMREEIERLREENKRLVSTVDGLKSRIFGREEGQ